MWRARSGSNPYLVRNNGAMGIVNAQRKINPYMDNAGRTAWNSVKPERLCELSQPGRQEAGGAAAQGTRAMRERETAERHRIRRRACGYMNPQTGGGKMDFAILHLGKARDKIDGFGEFAQMAGSRSPMQEPQIRVEQDGGGSQGDYAGGNDMPRLEWQ
jgi:hypothetical protein